MMTIQKMPLSSLHPSEKNVRRHTDKQIAEYVRSLRMFGQVRPLVVDGSGEIICGNGLFEALIAMGAQECDCYVRSDLTSAQKKKLMLADNRVYELGITDIDTFEDIIRELGEDTDVPGWDVDLLSALTASTPDIDQEVSSYGNFSADDTDRIRRVEQKAAEVQQSEGYTQQSTVSPQETPLQQPSYSFLNDTPVSYRPAAPALERPIPARGAAFDSLNRPSAVAESDLETQGVSNLAERYVVCPKCGERICL